MIEWRETNRRWWDERVPVHVSSRFFQAGLGIEWLHGHPFTFAMGGPFLEREGRLFRLPDDVPSLPLMYSLLATAPA